MQHSYLHIFLAILMAAFLFLGIFAALSLDSDIGRIEVAGVSIMDGEIRLSGLLYKPKAATADNPAPGVVVAHGICSSKEMMCAIGLELARRGFVTLCLDLLGHGQSQGAIEGGQLDPSFGVSAALRFLGSQVFVDSSALGLVGHSLGAGAVRAAAIEANGVGALVLIAGGVGNSTRGSLYGTFNSTFPSNLLVIVGKYDVLFDAAEIAQKELPAVFGTQQEIVPDVLYGSFASSSARKFVSPSTSHLFEPLDLATVAEIVAWMEDAFGELRDSGGLVSEGFVYIQREISIAVALVGLLGLIFLLFFPVQKLLGSRIHSQASNISSEGTRGSRWRPYVCWGAINLALLFPMASVGLLVQFPPLVFGASIAWWLLVSGLAGLLLIARFSQRIFGVKLSLRGEFAGASIRKDMFLVFVLFFALFAVVAVLDVGVNFRFRIITPILGNFSSAKRVLVFLTFVPFFLPYFFAEGLYLHRFASRLTYKKTRRGASRDFLLSILGKILPFVFVLFLHYGLKAVFDVWLLPGFAGFLLEFVWLIVPIFAIIVSFSWWFYKRTGFILPGMLFNALLTSWIAAVVFPF